jgi:hypothetical protein
MKNTFNTILTDVIISLATAYSAIAGQTTDKAEIKTLSAAYSAKNNQTPALTIRQSGTNMPENTYIMPTPATLPQTNYPLSSEPVSAIEGVFDPDTNPPANRTHTNRSRPIYPTGGVGGPDPINPEDFRIVETPLPKYSPLSNRIYSEPIACVSSRRTNIDSIIKEANIPFGDLIKGNIKITPETLEKLREAYASIKTSYTQPQA